MEASDFLLNLTQTGLVVIGLISFLYFFLDKKEFTPRDKQAVRFIFFHSIGLVFISLLPFPLFYSTFLSSYTWKISSCLFAAYTFYSGASTVYRVFKIKPSRPIAILIGHIVPSFTFTVLLVGFRGSISIYLLGLIWLFFSSIAQFCIAFLVHINPNPKQVYKKMTEILFTLIIDSIIEDPSNFRHLQKQRKLFGDIHPLFVSRCPQSKDLIKWLQTIPNRYLHFGDFDFAGLNIYINEFKKHLHDIASFYLPRQTLKKYFHVKSTETTTTTRQFSLIEQKSKKKIF